MNGNLKRFERAEPLAETHDEFLARMISAGTKPAHAEDAYAKLTQCETWQNDEYQVILDKETPHGFGNGAIVWHLSIARLDSNPIHDWRDMQAIKNMLVAPEAEAIELYPAQSRVMDTCNRFHLFALIRATNGTEYPKLPLGWMHGAGRETPQPTMPEAKQRSRV